MQLASNVMLVKERRDAKEILMYGERVLKEQGHIVPQYFIETPKEKGFILTCTIMGFGNEDEKQLALEQIRNLIQKNKADRALVLMDASMAVCERGELPHIRPSDRVDKIDCIMVQEFTKDLKVCNSIGSVYTKKGDSYMFSPLPFNPNGEHMRIETIWNPFLELEGSNERADRIREDINEEFFEAQANKLHKKFFKKFKEVKSKEDADTLLKEIGDEIKKKSQEINAKVKKNEKDRNSG